MIDRFHLMKNFTDAISKTRRNIQKEADEETKTLLKGCRWLLVKNKENLKAGEWQKLQHMLEASSTLKACFEFKEAFRDLFDQNLDYQSAEKRLLARVAGVEASEFIALHSFAKTLRNWWQQILNYFDGRHNNGFAEGVNLKIKILNRRGYGYRNFSLFRLHILVAFEPVSR